MTHRTRSTPHLAPLWLVLLCIAASAVSGCVRDQVKEEIEERREEEEATITEEACDHMEDGPSVQITGALSADENPPPVAADGKRYDLALVDAGGPKKGVVQFEPPEAGRYVVFLSSNVSLEAAMPDGTELPPTSEMLGVADCEAIVATYTFRMEAGAHALTFGPTNATDVMVVIKRDDI